MLRIEIVSTEFKALKGTSKTSGKPYDMAQQEAYLHTGGKYPDRFEVPLLERDASGNWIPYSPGFYVPTPNSFVVHSGRLSVDNYRLRLVLEAKPSVKAA